MNTNLLNIVQQIIDQYGEGVLAEPRRVSALFGDLARDIPAPQRNAFVKCLEHKFTEMLKNASEADRGDCKQGLAKRLNEQEGLDLNLCRNTVELLATALFGPQEESSPAQAAYDRADEHYDNGEDEEAIAELSNAIDLDPGFDEAYYLRGVIYRGIDRIDLALADFTQAIRINPDNAKVHGFRGKTKMEDGDLDGALKDLNEALRLKPRDRDNFYLTWRGEAKRQGDDLDGALKDLNEAVGLKPDYAPAYISRIRVYGMEGQWDMAIADCNTAIKLKPEDPEGYYLRGGCYKETGQRELAIQDFNKMLSFPDISDDDAQFVQEVLQELQ